MSVSPQKTIVAIPIDADLLDRAGRAGTNLSEAAERGIRRALCDVLAPRDDATRKAWQIENADAIRSHNDYVRTNGLPLAKYRPF